MITALLTIALTLAQLLYICTMARVGLWGLFAGGNSFLQSLFAASEELNRYSYKEPGLPSILDGPLFGVLMIMITAALAYLAVNGFKASAKTDSKHNGAFTLALALLYTALPIYFGIMPKTLIFLALYALLALCPVKNRMGNLLPIILCFALCFGASNLIIHGSNQAIEAYSEQIRDFMEEPGWDNLQDLQLLKPNLETVRKEGLLSEGGSADDNSLQFERDEKQQMNISIPEVIDYLKGAIYALLSLLAILLPVALLVLAGKRRKIALQRKAQFKDPDNAAAFKAMFRHSVACLQALGIELNNNNFEDLTPGLEMLISSEASENTAELGCKLLESYNACLPIWTKAAYSSKPISRDELKLSENLVENAEALLIARSSFKDLFRLRYIDCLLAEEADDEE